jgi:hypothetical protein
MKQLYSVCLSLTYLSFVFADTWKVTSSTPFPDNFFQTLIMEGLCTNGKDFIVSTKDQIYVTNDKFEVSISFHDAIPHNLRSYFGYNHLGDCQYDNGLIYFAVEEPSYLIPAIFVYRLSDTSIEFVTYKSHNTQQHAPWIAMDPATGLLYSSDYNNVTTLQIYNKDLEYVAQQKITIALDQVQGGAFYNGRLYLGVNSGDTVYAVDVSTGAVDVAVVQTGVGSPEEYEFEGITFLDLTAKGMGLMHNTGAWYDCCF